MQDSSRLETVLAELESVLAAIGPVVVAFSGGADSAFLAWVAHRRLGVASAHCVTAVSPSLASEELEDCARLAKEWGLSWERVATSEIGRPAYVANGRDRCYHCKSELMDALTPIATERGATIVLGVNLDDLGDHRPGQEAAAQGGARFPLVEAGITKSDLRRMSRALGLRTWDKPAAACLASRIPYGTPVTITILDRVSRAESALKRLGFEQIRVRDYGETARIEVEISDLSHAVDRREAVVAAVKDAGYLYVTLDLEGFRSGNLNMAKRGAGADPQAVLATGPGVR